MKVKNNFHTSTRDSWTPTKTFDSQEKHWINLGQ